MKLVAERVDLRDRVADEAVEVPGRDPAVALVAASAALQGLPAATGNQSGVVPEVMRLVSLQVGTDDRRNSLCHETIIGMCLRGETSTVRVCLLARMVDECLDVATYDR